ncbi:MAG: sulfatase-like hydrolase/transferase [Alphaproteobacteria bacterium]|nr:sulfatase-like hydrolase/transferase [Alphaproteobacteria bacterium]
MTGLGRAARAALAGLAALLWALAPARAADAPNIVIFFADDLGYGGVGVQGDREAVTPVIDSLAATGVRLTNAYANHPVCSPSRAALLTGVYQHRFGFEHNSGSPQNTSPKFGIAASVPTLPERLKAAGYATGMFGKWHVGFRPETQPTARGFDTFYGHLSGAHAYTPAGRQGRTAILRGTEPAPMPRHLTEQLADEAAGFIDANKDRPFFVYLPFNAVHSPLDTTPEYLAKFAHVADEKRRTHLAMLLAMDDAMGRVMDRLKTHGLMGRTLIIFASDNGGPTAETTSSNLPLSGSKGTMLEGGIRVPTLLRWDGVLPAGTVYDGMAMGFDLTATALAAAGVLPERGLDGVDLVPYLTGEREGSPHEALFWRAGPAGAVRMGAWKMIRVGPDRYLFNLEDDIAERTDLASTLPGKLAELERAYSAWSGAMMDPLWVRNEGAGGDRPSPDRLRGAYRELLTGP